MLLLSRVVGVGGHIIALPGPAPVAGPARGERGTSGGGSGTSGDGSGGWCDPGSGC